MGSRRILIVDNNDELRAALHKVLTALGHEVESTGDRDLALARPDIDEFDLIISDLTEDYEAPASAIASTNGNGSAPNGNGNSNGTSNGSGKLLNHSSVKAFKLGAANFVRRPYNDELAAIVANTLAYKLKYVDDPQLLAHLREKIEFELPSDVALMHDVINYLLDRVARIGLIDPERSNLFVALDEAFVNAVKHGNKNDPNRIVRVSADLSSDEARFTFEDEGEGFDVTSIPDPLDPKNLFCTSGRGVLLIHNIMDEVEYSGRGNRLTMVKRPERRAE